MKKNVGHIILPDFGECDLYVSSGYYDAVTLVSDKEPISIDLVNLRYVNGCTTYLSINDLEVFEDYMKQSDTRLSFRNKWQYILYQRYILVIENSLMTKDIDPKNVILSHNKVFAISQPDFRLLKFNEGYKLHYGFIQLTSWGTCEVYMIGGIYNAADQKPYIFIESIYGNHKTALYINKPEYYLSTRLDIKQLFELNSFLEENDGKYSNWYNMITSWQSSNTDDDDFDDIEKPDYKSMIKGD